MFQSNILQICMNNTIMAFVLVHNVVIKKDISIPFQCNVLGVPQRMKHFIAGPITKNLKNGCLI